MAKSRNLISSGVSSLYAEIHLVLAQARGAAYRAVNFAMVQAYWHVGRLIVEHEQGGQRRAAYGEAVLEELSQRLTAEFGRGFDGRNLRYMRQFYLAFSIRQTPHDESAPPVKLNASRSESDGPSKGNALRSKSPHLPIREAASLDSDPMGPAQNLRAELSWTHYRLLLSVEDPIAREWYVREAADQHWSTRQLERQISVLYYERLLASRKKTPVRTEARNKLRTVDPEQFIRDSCVLEEERGHCEVLRAERRPSHLRRQVRAGSTDRSGAAKRDRTRAKLDRKRWVSLRQYRSY